MKYEIERMSRRAFDSLPEYSCTLPTGQTIGKTWKRRVPYDGDNPTWFIGEYVPDPDPKFVGISWRKIEVKETT